MTTVFEKIIAGDIPAVRVYEDEHVIAILDIAPVTEGHTLVIPKNPVALLSDLPFTDSTHVFSVVRKLTKALREALSCDAVTVLLRDGPAAGQEVPHLHVHLIPRYENDSLGPGFGGAGEQSSTEEREVVAEKIRATL